MKVVLGNTQVYSEIPQHLSDRHHIRRGIDDFHLGKELIRYWGTNIDQIYRQMVEDSYGSNS